MRGGWYLVAFEDEVAGDLTALDIGDLPLVLVADQGQVRAYDAVCPHQGAHLAYGGRLVGRHIVCPFHGNKITLGAQVGSEYHVVEHATLGYGGMVFVRLGTLHENGLGELLEQLVDGHVFIPFNRTSLNARGELVIENAFDASHFRPVHGVRNSPAFEVHRDKAGAFVAEGSLRVPPSQWHRSSPDGEALELPFHARAVSPQLVLSHIGGADPYWIFTATTPTASGCIVRQALAVPQTDGELPDADRIAYLARASKAGMEQDRLIWEHLRPLARPVYEAEDVAVKAFRAFCDELEMTPNP
jgi:3-ketosteroid 9alpha-monooxygenase subunit A